MSPIPPSAPDSHPPPPHPQPFHSSPPPINIPYHDRITIVRFAAQAAMTPAEFIINACEIIHSLDLEMPESILEARQQLLARKDPHD